MAIIKLLGGLLLVILAFLLYRYEKWSEKQDWTVDEALRQSIGCQGYIVSATMLIIGLYLIIDSFNDF